VFVVIALVDGPPCFCFQEKLRAVATMATAASIT
jgi:hypothetical protein